MVEEAIFLPVTHGPSVAASHPQFPPAPLGVCGSFGGTGKLGAVWFGMRQSVVPQNVTVQTGFWPFGALIYDSVICVEGNRLLLTGFQPWGTESTFALSPFLP